MTWQRRLPEALDHLTTAYYSLLRANQTLDRGQFANEGYGDRIDVIDAALLTLLRGRWAYNRATGDAGDRAVRTNSSQDLAASIKASDDATTIADALSVGPGRPVEELRARALREKQALLASGTEIAYSHGVPIVPSIAPIVILHGSSRDMGRQYAEQVLEIFGRFIFAQIAAKDTGGGTRDILDSWTEQLLENTPWIVEFARGIAEGSTANGLPMSVEQAITMFTDTRPPSAEPLPIGMLDAEDGGLMGAYFGTLSDEGASPQHGLCSGAAGWGAASSDGRAHFAASTDHDCDFQVTIVAFPNDGYAFIHTPFSANGSIAGVGRFGFAGHPAINANGVAYVHHGGGNSCSEPEASWGFGVPRGASTMHALRYADSARAALTIDSSLPVGDAGRLLGSAGGFFVDDSFGYVMEDRTPGRTVIRQSTPSARGDLDGVLYATNNLQSPALGEAFCPPPGGYSYDIEAGWFTEEPQAIGTAAPGVITRQKWSRGAAPRNRFLHRRLASSHGSVTAESLRDLWKADASPGATPIEEPVGFRGNAFVAFGTPATGRYSAGIGMLAPRWATASGGHGFYYVGESGTHWDLTLDEAPLAVTNTARAQAVADIDLATSRLDGTTALADSASLARLLHLARTELRSGDSHLSGTDGVPVAVAARACRAFTRAQVRARQVINGVEGST